MALHNGDIGAVIRLTSDDDISTQTSLSIKYRKPDGTEGSFTGTVNGTTNVQYTTTSADDLDQSGEWEFQGYAELSGGAKVHSTMNTKEVKAII